MESRGVENAKVMVSALQTRTREGEWSELTGLESFFYICYMLNKREHIDLWIKQAEDDWGAVEALLHVGKYVQSLFWAHLVAEKYAKAVWIKYNPKMSPLKPIILPTLFLKHRLRSRRK